MNRILALFAAVSVLSGCSTTGNPVASTSDSTGFNARPTAKEFVVKNDSGGYVVAYAMRVAQLKQDKKTLRFAGRCDSACTMYLGLPRNKVCVEPGAYFRFHRPMARSSATVAAATDFLMRSYPGWVRQWIAANGGLTSSLKTMNYNYASKYLPTCGVAA
ncbi:MULTISPECIES: hypothetical protein [Mesorhizobium]|uniref:Lipoprotein n=1 Tax=Mesorhizobium denitrificans TaxID=2294114 RepID=A0A371XEG2_9HYPH|nr:MULTISPECIES: hypothetical protein [Mesorhizobium]RFC67606.1 hypothetical protein DY251_11580 [Mesorhizobium denitrificans]